MADHRIVYLIVERGDNGNKETFWRHAGSAYECRDGSFNLKLDMFPQLTFNIRQPKSNGELNDAVKSSVPQRTPQKPTQVRNDDIPF